MVNVGVSGTGGGFKRFAVGETDICDASRPIKDKERETAEENGIEYHELMVGRDGLSVVVNKTNDWATCMTVPELRMLLIQEHLISSLKRLLVKFRLVDPISQCQRMIMFL